MSDVTAPSSPRGIAKGSRRQKVTRGALLIITHQYLWTHLKKLASSMRRVGNQCAYLATYTRGRLVPPQLRSILCEQPVGDGGQLVDTPAPASVTNTYRQSSRSASPEGNSTTIAGQYLGPTSPYTFLRRAWRRFEEDGIHAHPFRSAGIEPVQGEPIFEYGDGPMRKVRVEEFKLPDKATTSHLVEQYFHDIMPTYRFLHADTVISWLETYHRVDETGTDDASLPPARQAIILNILAMSSLFMLGKRGALDNAHEDQCRESERFYQVARHTLCAERGRPKLESIQARLTACLYLLYTKRPNRAWYIIGTTVQLTMALGLHRAASAHAIQQDYVTSECRKRAFWTLSTLDTYLSVILGRPPLLRLDDIDQQYPDALDDEDFTAAGPLSERRSKDTIVHASILHAQIARVVKKALEEQYSVRVKTSQQQLDIADSLNKEAAAWQTTLPIIMSGAIHASSLITIFRRQHNVLQLAHAHALMLINRPSLLLDQHRGAFAGYIHQRSVQVHTCLRAAKAALDTIVSLESGASLLDTSWFSQYVAFNAVSVVYVWLIQSSHERLPQSDVPFTNDDLFVLAERVQRALTMVSQANAPSLRYNIVLEELQEETRRLMHNSALHPPRLNGVPPGSASVDNERVTTQASSTLTVVHSASGPPTAQLMPDMLNGEFPFDPDLWLQLDAFPFSDFGQPE